MKYRNKETGRVIDVQSTMMGVWEPVEAPKKKEPAKKDTKGAKKK